MRGITTRHAHGRQPMPHARRSTARTAIRLSLLFVALLAGISECAALWRARRHARAWSDLSAEM